MANSLRTLAISKARTRKPLFVVATSKEFVKSFAAKSDTAIKLYQDKGGREMAMLSKHYAGQFTAARL